MPYGPGLCHHCSVGKICRPRSLCWVCFMTPSIRDTYPTKDTKFNRRGYGGNRMCAPIPPEPTRAMPGTTERVEEYERRAKGGYSIFHPADPVDEQTRRNTVRRALFRMATSR